MVADQLKLSLFKVVENLQNQKTNTMVMILNDNINTTDIIILSFELNKFSHILTHRTISNDNKINVFATNIGQVK